MNVPTKLLDSFAQLPTRAKPGDAGADLYAIEAVTIMPGERKLIRTGLAMAIPEGYYGRIADRSGLALKSGISVKGGVVDAAYRGEVGVILINESYVSVWERFMIWIGAREAAPFKVAIGLKIAQLIITPCVPATFRAVDELDQTERADGGFGSTGK